MAYNKSSSRMAYSNTYYLFQMSVQEQAGQASVVSPFASGLTLCGFCLVTSIHITSVYASRIQAGSLAPPPQLKVPPLNNTSVLEEQRQADTGEAANSICRGLCFQR